MTKLAVGLLLVSGILVGSHFISVSAVGSTTYETSNGFPSDFLTGIVNSDVVKKKLLSRWKWEVWDVVPGTHAYQIYVFNVTNPDEVEKGGKPKLQQVGPYYYKEYRYKFDVSMNLDLSVNFVRNFTYTFDQSKSQGSDKDLVNMVNVPLIVFSTLASKFSTVDQANQAVAALVASGETLIKKNIPVCDLLFHGVDVSKYQKYLNLLGPDTLLTEEFKSGLQSILKLKNGVHEGQFTVDSGLKDEQKVGDILFYNENKTLTYWDGATCNQIQGSDGSVFPPHTQPSDSLHMLEVDLCRSISFDYQEDVPYKSITGRRYSISNNVLAEPSSSSGNECFCRKGGNGQGTCLKKGALDVSRCQFDAPYVMSYAHFLDASPDYQQGVLGLTPDPTKHRTEVTIEPVTGAVIVFHKRYQWNIWIEPLVGIDYFKKFPNILFPILWNDDIFMLDPDKEELLLEELASQGGGMGSGAMAQQQDYSKSVALALFILIGIFLVGRDN